MNVEETVTKIYDGLGTSVSSAFSALFSAFPKLLSIIAPVLWVFLALAYWKNIVVWVKNIFSSLRGQN